MTRPNLQRATAISFAAHIAFLLAAAIILSLRPPHKSRVYTIDLISLPKSASPKKAGAPAKSPETRAREHARRSLPPKRKLKTVEAEPEAPAKKPAMAVKKAPAQPVRPEPKPKAEPMKPVEDKAEEAIEEKQETEEAKALARKKRLEELRNRMAARGAAGPASGLSGAREANIMAAYSSSIMSSIKGNWVFPEVMEGTRAEVSITVFADGTIKINKMLNPSGNRAFDQSVLKAIVKTGSVEPPPFGQNEDVILNFIPAKE